MTMKKKRILALIAAACVGLLFLLRYLNEQVPMTQIFPDIDQAALHAHLLSDDGMREAVVTDAQFTQLLCSARFQHGKESRSMPSPAFEIRALWEDDYSIVIGADGTMSFARYEDLEGTRTFWKDPTGELFDQLYALHLESGGQPVPDYVGLISFSDQDFSKVHSIALTNCHNGKKTYIEDGNSVTEICDFLFNVSGKDGTSAKGYYEGSYALSLYENTSASLAQQENEPAVFSIVFGDLDSFYYGEYGDGYPVRFALKDISIDEVISFLGGYDEHPIS